MKITETLFVIFSKMDKKETKELERYLAYKNRKKLIELYKCFPQKENVDSVIYSIKRKKLERNLRYNLNELLELVKKFWVDQADNKSTSKVAKIFNMIFFSENLHKKGMFEDAIEQFKQAEQLSNENYLYPLSYHISRKLAILSWRQYPEDSEKYFEELRIKHDNYLGLMGLNSEVSYLSERTMFLLYKGLWSLNDDQLEFLHGVEERCVKLLQTEELTNNFRIGLLQQLGYLSWLIKMDGEAACKYAGDMVNTLNNSSLSYSIKDFNKIVSYEFLLKLLKLMDKTDEFAKRFKEFTDFFESLDALNPTSVYLFAYTLLYNLKINITDDELFHRDIGKVHYFLKKFGLKMSPKFIGGIQRSLFEIYYYRGDYEDAAACLDNLKEVNNTKMPNLKFLEFTAEVLLAYENGEDEFIINRCHSFRRVTSKFLTFNPAGNLFISCFIKLCKTNDPIERKEILREFKPKFEPLLKNIRHRYMLLVHHIIPWMDSKIHDYPTVVDYLNSHAKEKAKNLNQQK